MTSPVAKLWRHGQHSERQKPELAALPRPAATVAYGRQPRGPQGALAVPVLPVVREPDPDVQCEYCKVIGPSSVIPDFGRGHMCRTADIDACTQRYLAGALPQEMPQAIGEMDEDAEQHMAAFNEAHDEEDAREAEAAPETCPAGPEPGMTPNPSAPGGSSTGHHTANPRENQVSDRPGTPPAATENAPEAELGAEEEAEPAAEQDEAPAPVAEVSDPAPQEDPSPTD